MVAARRISSALRLVWSTRQPVLWLDGALAVSAAAYIALFLVSAVVRVPYPYALDPTEPAALFGVERLLQGHALYGPPTLQHVPLIYGPASFYLAAVAATFGGPSYAVLRGVSLLASIGSMALLFSLVRQETGTARSGLLAAGLFAACNPLVATAMDNGRVDALFTCLLLASARCVRTAGARSDRPNVPAATLGGILLALAAFTKLPIGAAPVGLALAIYLILTDRRLAIAFALAALGGSSLIVVLLRLQTGPWASWYVWDLARQHGPGRDLLGRFWINDMLPRFTLALSLGPLFLIAAARRGHRQSALFYGPLALSLLGIAWASRTNGGGAPNVLLPACAAAALLFGLGLDAALRLFDWDSISAAAFRPYWLGIGIVQLALLAYNPRPLLPIRSDRWADERLDAALAAHPGPIFAPDFAGYPSVAARGEQPLLSAVGELWGVYGGPRVAEGDQWDMALSAALQERRFRYIVLAGEELRSAVRGAGYVDKGRLIADDDDFYFWRTPRTPIAELYVAPGP